MLEVTSEAPMSPSKYLATASRFLLLGDRNYNSELSLILILGTDSTFQADGFQDSKKSADSDLEKIKAIKAQFGEVAKSCKGCHEKSRTK